MLRLPTFTFHQPKTVEEAVRVAADHGREAKFVGGGTDLYPNMKRRHQQPAHVVSLAKIADLHGIHGDPKVAAAWPGLSRVRLPRRTTRFTSRST